MIEYSQQLYGGKDASDDDDDNDDDDDDDDDGDEIGRASCRERVCNGV